MLEGPQLRAAGGGPPVPDSTTTYEDWVFALGRWWFDLLPRPTLDVFRPNDPAGVGHASGCFF